MNSSGIFTNMKTKYYNFMNLSKMYMNKQWLYSLVFENKEISGTASKNYGSKSYMLQSTS